MNIDTLAQRIAAAEPIRSLQMSDDRWPELDCEGAAFVDCAFEQVQFSNPLFVEARFTNCRFVSCRFSHAELSGAQFEDCRFTGDGAKGCSFAFGNLQRTLFSRCDLSQAVFDRTELFAVEMRDCNLTGARFNTVDFSRALSRKKIETREVFTTASSTSPTFPERNCRAAALPAAGSAKPTCPMPT